MKRPWITALVLMAAASANDTAARQGSDSLGGLSGEQLFIACIGCHDISADGVNKVGPNLHGIIGQQAGTVEGFKYSPALVKAGEEPALTW